jgi:hypothetical protein
MPRQLLESKVPSSKFQAPEKLQTPIPNLTLSKRLELGTWDLEFPWNLGFGTFPAIIGRKAQ